MNLVFDHKTFLEQEQERGTHLIETLQRPKYRRLKHPELSRRNAVYLYANNPTARVRFARVFLSGVMDHLKSRSGGDRLKGAVYLVTFALERFCCPLKEAERYDLRPLQAWVRQAVEGLSYLGMTEAAFYSNKSLPGQEKEPTVSWHVHLLVWGVSRPTLKTLVDGVSAKHPSLIPGLPSGHYRLIKPKDLASKTLYMLKSPQEYRVWPVKEEVIDPETGEITVHVTDRYRQKSRDLRPKDRVRMCAALQDRYLDWMMLGGGAGKDLLRSIRKQGCSTLIERPCMRG
jgi:hypothetical protein